MASEPDLPLTPEQQAEADKLYRHILRLRASGVRQVVVILDGDKIGVRATGERVDVANVRFGVTIAPTA